MSFKKLVEKYWKDFEVIAFNFIKQKLPQTLIKKEVITQSVKDGGYDGEFLLVSEQKNQIKILFEAKLRSNINGSLPLQEFAKAIIISIVSQADILYIVTNIRFSKNTIEILENYSKFVPLGIELANGLTIKKYILNDINSADKTTQELFDFLVENCEVAVEQNIRSFKPKLLCPSLYEKFESDSATLEVRNLFKNSNEVLVITGNIGSGKSSFIDNMSFYYQCKGKIVSTIDLSKCMTYKDLFIELLEKTLGLSLAVVNQIDEPTFTEIILGNKYIETSQEDIDMLNFIFSKKNEHLYDYSYLFSIIVNFYEKICCLSKNRLNLIIAFKNAAYSHNEVLQLLLYFLKSENTFSSIVELTNDVYLNGDVHFWNSFKENIMSLATYQNWNVNDWSLMEAKHFLMKKVNGLTEEQILSLIHKFGSSPAELANLIEIIDTTEIYVSNPKSLIYAEIMSLNLNKKDILYYKCFEYLQLSNSNMLYLFAFIYFLSGEVYFDLLYEFFNNQNSVENILHLTRKSSLFYVNAQKIEIRNSKIEEQLNKYCEEHLTEFTTRDIIILQNLRLIQNDYLTQAAILLFAENPEKYITGAYIKIGFFESDSELRFQDEIHGSLIEQVDKTMEILRHKYMKAWISYDGVQRVETYPYPEAALREAIFNAVAHKQYISGIPIQISVYKDKIYIYNNGKLPEMWTLEKLFSKHPSQPYNPLIANTFFVAGYIESWGRGIDKICTACENAGLQKPTYEIDATGIMLQIKANVDWDGNEIKYDENGNKITVQKKQTEKPDFTENFTENFTEKQKQLIAIVLENPTITTTEISSLMGYSRTTVSTVISELKKLGVLERIGSDKKGYWNVKIG